MAIILASVVFPVPGGPHKSIEKTWSSSIARRRIFPGPSRAFWPTKPSRPRGLIRSARGLSGEDVTELSNRSIDVRTDSEAGESDSRQSDKPLVVGADETSAYLNTNGQSRHIGSAYEALLLFPWIFFCIRGTQFNGPDTMKQPRHKCSASDWF